MAFSFALVAACGGAPEAPPEVEFSIAIHSQRPDRRVELVSPAPVADEHWHCHETNFEQRFTWRFPSWLESDGERALFRIVDASGKVLAEQEIGLTLPRMGHFGTGDVRAYEDTWFIPDAPQPMLAWGEKFTWCYADGTTDMVGF